MFLFVIVRFTNSKLDVNFAIFVPSKKEKRERAMVNGLWRNEGEPPSFCLVLREKKIK